MQRFCLVQRLSLVSALLLVALPVPTHAEQPVPFKGNRTVTVMTRNVYHFSGHSGCSGERTPAGTGQHRSPACIRWRSQLERRRQLNPDVRQPDRGWLRGRVKHSGIR